MSILLQELYGRDTILVEDIKASLYSVDLRKKVLEYGTQDQAECLIVRIQDKSYQNRNRLEKHFDNGGKIGRSRSKSRFEKNSKCYYYKILGHYQRDCYKHEYKGKSATILKCYKYGGGKL